MFNFKLLCTLACLYEGTPLQPLRIDFFGIKFYSHPCFQWTFLTFHRQENRTRGKVRRYHMSALRSPTCPPPRYCAPPPPTTYLLSRQASRGLCAISRCRALLEEYFLASCEIFYFVITLLLPLLLTQTASIHHIPLRW